MIQSLLSHGADVDVRNRAGRTALTAAVLTQAADAALLRLLLEAGADVQSIGVDTRTALHHAVERGRYTYAELLLDSGADVNAADADGNTALVLGAGRRDVKKLLKERGAVELEGERHTAVIAIGGATRTRSHSGEQALRSAASDGDIEAVRAFVAAGADVNAASSHGVTALRMALLAGHEDAVRVLLDAGARPKPRDFLLAAKGGLAEAVRAFLDAGADVNLAPNGGDNPLMAAARKGRLETVRVLLQAGGSLNPDDAGELLSRAAFDGELIVVRSLVEAGAPVDTPDPMNHWTPLEKAAHQGHAEVVRVLIAHGATMTDEVGLHAWGLAASGGQRYTVLAFLDAGLPADTPLNGGGTALDWAAANGFTATVELLLSSGAKPSVEALARAAYRGQTGTTRQLLDAGASVNGKLARVGRTPLMLAAGGGRVETAKILLDAGAHINAESGAGATALMRAAMYGQADVVRFLLEQGASPNKRARNGTTALIVGVDVRRHGSDLARARCGCERPRPSRSHRAVPRGRLRCHRNRAAAPRARSRQDPCIPRQNTARDRAIARSRRCRSSVTKPVIPRTEEGLAQRWCCYRNL